MLVRGTKTQTVNVCTLEDRAGDYEHVYRLPIAEDVQPADLAEMADAAALHDWVTNHNGLAEQREGQGGRAVLPLVEVEEDRDWLAAATTAVETVLDDVVTEFWRSRTCTASNTRCTRSCTSASRTKPHFAASSRCAPVS